MLLKCNRYGVSFIGARVKIKSSDFENLITKSLRYSRSVQSKPAIGYLLWQFESVLCINEFDWDSLQNVQNLLNGAVLLNR